LSRGLGEAMVGINAEDVPEPHRRAERGWQYDYRPPM
jgi:pyridoxal biosynthesis lyase PdxS